MKLTRDDDGIHVSIKTEEQVELCDYILVNGVRFIRETDYAANTRQKITDPKTGHAYGCTCFICNH